MLEAMVWGGHEVIHVCWDLRFFDAQTGSMNSVKVAMKVETKFSSNSQENSTLYTVE